MREKERVEEKDVPQKCTIYIFMQTHLFAYVKHTHVNCLINFTQQSANNCCLSS